MSQLKIVCLNIATTVLTTIATLACLGASGPPSGKFNHLFCNTLHIMDEKKEYGIHMLCDKTHGPIIELTKNGEPQNTYITVKGLSKEASTVAIAEKTTPAKDVSGGSQNPLKSPANSIAGSAGKPPTR